LSFSVPARMVERSVEVGDRVASGDVIARLDVREFDNAVNSAKAAMVELNVRLAQARRDRQRFQRLVKDGISFGGGDHGYGRNAYLGKSNYPK
ncbi:MAG: biotin/lipoyl-binding protein, partial [Desulfobacterales bacterium]